MYGCYGLKTTISLLLGNDLDLWPLTLASKCSSFLTDYLEYLHAYLIWYGFWVIAKKKVIGQNSRSPVTFDLDIFRCTICHLRWMVKVPSLYDKWLQSYKMFRKVVRKHVIRDTFRETFFCRWDIPNSHYTHPTNQISDICYGSGLFSGTVFFGCGGIIPLSCIIFFGPQEVFYSESYGYLSQSIEMICRELLWQSRRKRIIIIIKITS